MPFIEYQESEIYLMTYSGNHPKKTIKFLAKKRQKPGRKSKIEKKKLIKEHDKNEPTNIFKKVNTHFLTFLIDFSNDLIKSIFIIILLSSDKEAISTFLLVLASFIIFFLLSIFREII